MKRRRFIQALAGLPLVARVLASEPRPMLDTPRVEPPPAPEPSPLKPGDYAGLYNSRGEEVSGDGYARVPASLDAPIVFPAACSTWGEVSAVALFSFEDATRPVTVIQLDGRKCIMPGDVIQIQVTKEVFE